MARAKTPRNGNTRNKQVANTPAVGFEVRKSSSPVEVEAEIRRRAYELYERRGCAPGHEEEDWLVAEREIRARYNYQHSV